MRSHPSKSQLAKEVPSCLPGLTQRNKDGRPQETLAAVKRKISLFQKSRPMTALDTLFF